MRRLVKVNGEFILVHVATPLGICEQRDPKGLYAKARRREFKFAFLAKQVFWRECIESSDV